MPQASSPFTAADGGVRVALRVTPKAPRPGIAGVGLDAAGRPFLRVRVDAAPADGKANAAVVKLLAAAWDVPRSRIRIASGAKDRRKTLHVAGETEALLERLGNWFASRDA